MGKVAPITAKAGGGGDFELPEPGVYVARCYKMVDVGTQTTTGQYGTKEQRQVYIYWELLTDDEGDEVKMEDGQLFSIFNSYTLSMNKKANLRKHLDSWRGVKFTEEEAAEFDITKLLGTYCKLQITHSKSKDGEKTYANVDGIMVTKKRPEGVNELVAFSIEAPDMDVFNELPEWLQNKIEDAPEWSETTDDETTTASEPAAPAKSAKAAAADEDDNTIDIKDVQF